MTGLHDADLYRLTYLSASRAAMPRTELDAILEASRTNNSRRAVTGLLLYHDAQFFQALEGPKAQVEEAFAIIKRDPRHSGCLVLESRPVAARFFDRWSMGYRSADDLSAGQKQSFLELASVRGQYAGRDAAGDARTRILMDSFLSSLRDLDLP